MLDQVGPVNYKVVLEDSGKDLKVVNIARLRPCYPAAQNLEEQRILEILKEESDEEHFLGFEDTSCSTFNEGWRRQSARKNFDSSFDSEDKHSPN